MTNPSSGHRATVASSRSRRTLLVAMREALHRDLVRQTIGEKSDRWFEADSAADAVALTTREHPELIVLDPEFPDMEGVALCRRLRTITRAPIAVVSGRDSEDTKVAFLEAGADDYVTRPFGALEFRARVRAQLRRVKLNAEVPRDQPMVVGGLEIDPQRRTVSRNNHAMHLTPTEWALLIALSSSPGRTLTHQQLFRTVWGDAHGQPQQYLRVYITHLRKKVEIAPDTPRLIVTEPGVGYRFEPDPG